MYMKQKERERERGREGYIHYMWYEEVPYIGII